MYIIGVQKVNGRCGFRPQTQPSKAPWLSLPTVTLATLVLLHWAGPSRKVVYSPPAKQMNLRYQDRDSYIQNSILLLVEKRVNELQRT